MPRASVRLFAIIVLAVVSSTGATADTYPRQPGGDAQHYVFRLTLLTGDSNEIQGEATATFRLVTDEVHEIALDLATPTVDAKGMTVVRVTSAGQRVPFTHRENRLRLPVPAGSKAGQEATFTITYHGVPASGLRLINNIHGERVAFSENWHNLARQWLPMIDHPADKATGEFIVTTRAEYQVVANGALLEQVDLAGGQRRTHWTQAVPISSWLYALGVARFAVRHAGTVRAYQWSTGSFRRTQRRGLRCSSETDEARSSFSRIVSVPTCTKNWRMWKPPARAAAWSTRATFSTVRRELRPATVRSCTRRRTSGSATP